MELAINQGGDLRQGWVGWGGLGEGEAYHNRIVNGAHADEGDGGSQGYGEVRGRWCGGRWKGLSCEL